MGKVFRILLSCLLSLLASVSIVLAEEKEAELEEIVVIVPLKNPLSLKVGDALPIKVFYEGKPIEGVAIYGVGYHKEKIRTDRYGMANVIIEKVGNQKIGAIHKIHLDNNPDADYLVRTTNITFEVKQ